MCVCVCVWLCVDVYVPAELVDDPVHVLLVEPGLPAVCLVLGAS